MNRSSTSNSSVVMVVIGSILGVLVLAALGVYVFLVPQRVSTAPATAVPVSMSCTPAAATPAPGC